MTRPTPFLRWLKIFAPVALIATGIALVASGLDAARLQSMLSEHSQAAPIGFVIISILLMSVMVPKTVVSVTAGALFGTSLGSGLMLVVAVVAAALNYSIGRWWLADSIESRIRRQDQTPTGEILRTAQSMAGDAGFGFHLMIRLAPIPTMMISYLMGACGGRFAPFLAATAVAVIPQSLWVHSGTIATAIDDPQAGGLRWMGIALSVIGAIAISVAVPREAMKRLKRQRLTEPGAVD
ncbi:TVP38/TMEM64 family protein [Rubripirellula tenax]|uniref:TVP38/TMEM64 family protein n=1 Tax=Rubripirellula tenax TaxID=2528015 RepID=UPI001C98A675|nr:VTT domain-containing protein [Rubripirellula tenax]